MKSQIRTTFSITKIVQQNYRIFHITISLLPLEIPINTKLRPRQIKYASIDLDNKNG